MSILGQINVSDENSDMAQTALCRRIS